MTVTALGDSSAGRVEILHIPHMDSLEGYYRWHQWQDKSRYGWFRFCPGATKEVAVVHLRVDQGTVKLKHHHMVSTRRPVT